jgi:hypothetical protein
MGGASGSPAILPYNGDGVSGLLVWGMQMEDGPIPTSYIPTLGSPGLRAADSAVVSTANWYNPSAGSILATGHKRFGATLGSGVVEKLFSFSGAGGADYSVLFDRDSGSLKARLQPPGGVPASEWNSSYGVGPESEFNLMLLFDSSNPAMMVGGNISTSPVGSAGPLSANTLNLGGTGGSSWNGYLKALTVWPARLSDALSLELSQ